MNLKQNLDSLVLIPSDINALLPALYERARSKQVVVELGVRGGVSTQALLCGVAEGTGKLYSYDIEDIITGAHVYFNGTSFFERLDYTDPYIKERWKFKQVSSLEVYKDWPDESIDVLFIDTDHTKEQIYKELTLWVPKVKRDGCILMHDVCVPRFDLKLGVNQYLSEHPELDYDELTYNNGLGIITKGSN